MIADLHVRQMKHFCDPSIGKTIAESSLDGGLIRMEAEGARLRHLSTPLGW
jgi:hypothetical protein